MVVVTGSEPATSTSNPAPIAEVPLIGLRVGADRRDIERPSLCLLGRRLPILRGLGQEISL
jgi:hypothetical protein